MTFRDRLVPDRDRTTLEVPRPPKVALSATWRAVLAIGGRPDRSSATLEGFEFDYTPPLPGSSGSMLRPTLRYSVRAAGRPDGTTQVRVVRLGPPLRDRDPRFPLLFLPGAVESELAREAPARSVFLSYRRHDSADVSGRILDRLRTRFGTDAVFRDVDDIAPGADFRRAVDSALADARCLLAVIGPAWSGAPEHRLGNPEDMVRIEVESALARGVPVLPVLVMRAAMPSRRALPPSMRALSDLNALPVRPDPDFEHDVRNVLEKLAPLLTG